ncbi:MAG: FxsA family protein [Myxococcota bacterium]|nr:FxsA family protein [Myxococcota bacterium]
MFRILALLFITVPLLELAILIRLGEMVGLASTIGLIFVTGVLGAALARHEGSRVFLTAVKQFQGGQVPTGSIMNGLAIFMGGALLLTPGILTDVVGFLLVIPPTRNVISSWLGAYIVERIKTGNVVVQSYGNNNWSDPSVHRQQSASRVVDATLDERDKDPTNRTEV